MKKILLLLTAVLALGLYSACDEPEKIEEPINNNGNDNGKDTVDNKKDTIQVVPLGANQLRIGKDTISFTITDTLTVQEGAMRVFSWYDNPVTISTGSLNVDLNSDFLSKDINLSLTNLMDTVYDPLSFNFVVSGGSDSLFITLDWERDDNQQFRHILAGAINTDTVHSIFQTGTLRMDLDTPKKIFTFKISAKLFDGRDFEVFVSMPYKVQYIFNFYTYTNETWDQTHDYASLTDFSAFDTISDYLRTFTLEAADTTGQAKFEVFKKAVGELETIISLVNDSIAQEGFYNDKDCFMVKLITWGYRGNNRVLGFKKWFKSHVETWIPTDATLREKLYSTEDEDYGENYGWD